MFNSFSTPDLVTFTILKSVFFSAERREATRVEGLTLFFYFQSGAHVSACSKKIVQTGVWVEDKFETYPEHGQNIPRGRSKNKVTIFSR